MKIYDAVEQQIREAIERGEFDNLPNKGKPLDLKDWLKTPEQHRMSYSIMKNAGVAPEELKAKGTIAGLKADIKALDPVRDAEERNVLMKQLNEMVTVQNIRMERLRR